MPKRSRTTRVIFIRRGPITVIGGQMCPLDVYPPIPTDSGEPVIEEERFSFIVFDTRKKISTAKQSSAAVCNTDTRNNLVWYRQFGSSQKHKIR